MARNVKKALPELLRGVEHVSVPVFEELLRKTGASASYLRRLLRDLSYPLDPLVEGVSQKDPRELVRTLSALAVEYAMRPVESRNLVLESKRHCLLSLRRKPDEAHRLDVLLHLNTWLENPPLYPVWAKLQMKSAAHADSTAAPSNLNS